MLMNQQTVLFEF